MLGIYSGKKHFLRSTCMIHHKRYSNQLNYVWNLLYLTPALLKLKVTNDTCRFSSDAKSYMWHRYINRCLIPLLPTKVLDVQRNFPNFFFHDS